VEKGLRRVGAATTAQAQQNVVVSVKD